MSRKKSNPVIGIICSLIVAAVFLAVTFPNEKSASEMIKSSNLITQIKQKLLLVLDEN